MPIHIRLIAVWVVQSHMFVYCRLPDNAQFGHSEQWLCTSTVPPLDPRLMTKIHHFMQYIGANFLQCTKEGGKLVTERYR